MNLKRVYIYLLVLCVLTTLFSLRFDSTQAREVEPKTTAITAQYTTPSNGFFTENKGQWDKSIRFIGNTAFGRIAIANDGVYYQLIKTDIIPRQDKQDFLVSTKDKTEQSSVTQIIKVAFLDDQPSSIIGENPLQHSTNYLIGNDPSKWGIGCRSFSRIVYEGIGEGTDLVYSFTQDGLQHEYVYHSKTSTPNIRFKITGAKVIESNGTTELRTSIGSLFDNSLRVSDTNIANSTVSVCTIRQKSNPISLLGVVGWERLKYATFLGGDHDDVCASIAIDSEHNAYLTGHTLSSDFPMEATLGGSATLGYDQTRHLDDDVFVVKLNATGTELLYATYLGGEGEDYGNSITVDSQNNAYVAGRTISMDFPMSSTVGGVNAPGFDQVLLPLFNDPLQDDGFVVKLNATGTELLYSTYIGGWSADNCIDITLDADNNAYVTGGSMSGFTFPYYKNSATFESTPGYYRGTSINSNVFVIKLSASGTELLYSTMFEGSNIDIGMAIELDSGNNAIITGVTFSSDFSMNTTVGGAPAPGYDKTFNGGMMDAFVIKLNSAGTELLYATFLGGANLEQPLGLAVNTQGNAYITGVTGGADFPMTVTEGGVPAPGYDQTFDGISDGFAVELNAIGTELLYATFIGGSGSEQPNAIALDSQNNAYIIGETWSSDFPMGITNGGSPAPGYNQTFSTQNDAFLVKLNAAGTEYLYATYLGGSGIDNAQSVAVDSQFNAYITGYTQSPDFPMNTMIAGPPALGYDKTINPWKDGFVVKLNTTDSYDIFVGFTKGHGSVSPSMQSVQAGEDLCLPIMLDERSEIMAITDNGIPMPVTNPYCLQNVREDHYITIHVEMLYHIITAVVKGGHGTATPAYQEVKKGGMGKVTLLADLGYLIDTYSINGSVYTVTYPGTEFSFLFYNISSDYLIEATFRPAPKPVLDLSIELNKHEFCYGDDVLYKVTVHNTSAGPSTVTKLQVTLPREIQYVSADKYRGEVQSGGIVVFNLGTIPAHSSVTFQINASVALRTSVMTSAATLFYVSCVEDVFAETVVYTTFKSCDGGHPIPYIRVMLLNTKYDPETGERYIELGSELSMNVTIDGFTAPFMEEITWGDGERNTVEDQTEKTINFKHKYTSGGTMEIQIKVTDASGKSKTVSVRIRVK